MFVGLVFITQKKGQDMELWHKQHIRIHISIQGGQQEQHPLRDRNEKIEIIANTIPFFQSGFKNSIIFSLSIILIFYKFEHVGHHL